MNQRIKTGTWRGSRVVAATLLALALLVAGRPQDARAEVSADALSIMMEDASPGRGIEGYDFIVRATDSSGNPVDGILVACEIQGAPRPGTAVAASPLTTNSVVPTLPGSAFFEYSVAPDEVLGEQFTVRCTTGSETTLREATGTFQVVGVVESVKLSTSSIAGMNLMFHIEAFDAEGRPAADFEPDGPAGTALAVMVSAGSVVHCDPGFDNGVAACTFVPPSVRQEVTITVVAIDGSTILTESARSTYGGATFIYPPSQRSVAPGLNAVTFNGGTVGRLSAITAAELCASASVIVDGVFVTLVAGAPDFANAAFNAAFPSGEILAGTIVILGGCSSLPRA